MFVLRSVVVLFFLLVAQTTWIPRLRIAGIGPDLMVGLVLVLALRRGTSWGVWAGFLVGLLLGVEDPAALGVDSLALGLAGLAIGRAGRSMDKQNPFVLVILLMLAALIADTVRVIWMAGANPGDMVVLWFRWALPSVIYTATFVPLLAWASARVLGLRGWISSAA
jgi:rod shape-determining protein MreD